ncbi:hypothetical protein M0802_005958 [Mischocyttarus mexicanus]|nr:hypothetical protein M0802_005958 [Mischocyttarus mexicanus]
MKKKTGEQRRWMMGAFENRIARNREKGRSPETSKQTSKQDKTRQDKTRQDKTRQDKTRRANKQTRKQAN